MPEDPPRRTSTSAQVYLEADSPLTTELTSEPVPGKVKVPQIGLYDGTSDPDSHLGHYTSWMDLHGASDALRCRMFSLTLGPRAQKWFHSLPPHSIWKWQRSHFIGAQVCLIPKESLANVTKKDDESVKDYIARFNDRVQNMEPCHPETLLVMAIAGLKPNSIFHWTLCQNKPNTFQEFLARAQQHIIAEEAMSVPDFNLTRSPLKREPMRKRKTNFLTSKTRLNIEDLPEEIPTTLKKFYRNADPQKRGPGRQIESYDEDDEEDRGVMPKCIRQGDKEVFMFTSETPNFNSTGTSRGRKRDRSPSPMQITVQRVNTNNTQSTLSRRQIKAYARQAYNSSKQVYTTDLRDVLNNRNCPITFNMEDANHFAHPHFDALVITVPICGIPVHRVMVDTGTYSSILMLKAFDKIELIYVDEPVFHKSLRIGSHLQEPLRAELISFLKHNSDVFAWKHEDMKGIDPGVASHKLNLDRTVRPIVQKRRKLGPDRQKALEEEVKKLIDNKFIKEAKYPIWVSNPVLVKKSNGLWRLCIDFFDLNKACPKDSYPLPHIDYMVDATSGHELMSFMDAYSSYNQIPMDPEDSENTSFYSARGLYCYTMMPFGLKDAGATYQRLVNKMFANMIGHTMEVYVDNMLIKSVHASDHITHLQDMFNILRSYSMVLNPKKCTFGVESGKFLGYMVSQRGIEANPAKIKAIQDLIPPTSVKGVQALTGRLAALNRFISKSTDRCKPFFEAIKKGKHFEWTEECQKALISIKETLAYPPTLQKPKPEEILFLYLGVSDSAISAVLVREEGTLQSPIYYVSKALHDAELRYPPMEKLAFALVIAARKLRPYSQEHS
ncbi:Unknown protein, partial [Striga hermonthica]